MAPRDTWHRTLVYFGLAEEEDPRYETFRDPEPEAELEDRYRDRPNVRRLQRRRRDEIDDIFADEPREGRRETRVLRPVGGNGRAGGGGDIQVHLVIPKSFNDAQQIADQFKDAIPVILNLQGTDAGASSKRLIDYFASGLTYALDGGMQRIADKVFLLTPRNVEVSAEERARLIEKGFNRRRWARAHAARLLGVKLGFIGAGNMASALARGIGEPALVFDVDGAKAEALATELGGEAVGSNAELAERADAIVLCHKPKQLAEVAADVGGGARAVISILAATTTAQLEAAYPGAPVYRFIPNIPAEVRKGVLCYIAGSRAVEGPEREIVRALSGAPGR